MPILFFVIVALLQPALAPAARADDLDVKSAIRVQIAAAKRLEDFVERRHFGRLVVLQKTSADALAAIEQHGVGHVTAFKALQRLVITYKYSEAFLKAVDSEVNRPQLDRVQKVVDDIVTAYGFDEQPYTRITESTYAQIHKLIQQLRQQEIDPALDAALNALLPDLGRLIAVAAQGDRPRTYAAARSVYQAIAALYPFFYRIHGPSAAFDVVLEIHGLNEYYFEVAQGFDGVG